MRIKALATVRSADVGRMLPNGGVLPENNKELPAADDGARQAAAQAASARASAWDQGQWKPAAIPTLSKLTQTRLHQTRTSSQRVLQRTMVPAVGSTPVRTKRGTAAISHNLMINYDSFAFQHLILPHPLLMLVGEQAETLPHSQEAIERANEPQETVCRQGQGPL